MTAYKKFEGVWSASNFLKPVFHKFLLGPFLNTLSQMALYSLINNKNDFM